MTTQTTRPRHRQRTMDGLTLTTRGEVALLAAQGIGGAAVVYGFIWLCALGFAAVAA